MNNLYEVLEICLQDVEQGADVEAVLFRYPDIADELRPILEASLDAKSMAVPAPSAEVVRRNRAKVLQHAAQLRETNGKSSSRRMWLAPLRRVAVSLAVVIALFISGTSLVSAASTTLPGDNLYPVKRTWEDVLLLFTFDTQQRAALEVEQENERLHELEALFAEGRSAEVDFSGMVTSQNGNEWMVAGFTVVISPQTEVRDGPIVIGSAVRVRGWTQSNGIVLAERVRLLSPDAKLPDVDDELENEGENNQGPNGQNDDNSGKGSGDETPEPDSENESSNSGPGSNHSGSGSGDNNDDGDSNHNDNSGSGNNSGNDNNGDSGDNSGGGSNSGSGGGGEDNSGSGSRGEDNSGSGGGND
jgi:uncharacterized membrane protein YgcG